MTSPVLVAPAPVTGVSDVVEDAGGDCETVADPHPASLPI